MINWTLAVVIIVAGGLLSAGLTALVRQLALRWRVVDNPASAPDRKTHSRPVPLLGGWAIWLTFSLSLALLWLTGRLADGLLEPKYLLGLILGGLLVMIGGSLDDRFNLKPLQQIVWPIAAILVVISAGVGIDFITNPFGGELRFDTISLTAFSLNGIDYQLLLIADLVTFVWLMGMMYTTKLLDGLDGLVSGVTAIGSLIIFGVTQLSDVQQVSTGYLSLALAGSCLGFLAFNFAPARIYLGQGGSLLTGFLLGSLSIISGGKIATALLIMGLPILDVVWVISRRLFIERRSPFTAPDRKHLHFRLLTAGFSQRGAVLFLYGVTAVFGSATLIFRGLSKLYVLLGLVAIMVVLGVVLIWRERSRPPTAHSSTDIDG